MGKSLILPTMLKTKYKIIGVIITLLLGVVYLILEIGTNGPGFFYAAIISITPLTFFYLNHYLVESYNLVKGEINSMFTKILFIFALMIVVFKTFRMEEQYMVIYFSFIILIKVFVANPLIINYSKKLKRINRNKKILEYYKNHFEPLPLDIKSLIKRRVHKLIELSSSDILKEDRKRGEYFLFLNRNNLGFHKIIASSLETEKNLRMASNLDFLLIHLLENISEFACEYKTHEEGEIFRQDFRNKWKVILE